VGVGVQLGPLGTAASNRPIVSAPGDYDDGEIGAMIGRGNRSTLRKPASMPHSPPQTSHTTRTRTRAAALGSQRLPAELRHGLLTHNKVHLRVLSRVGVKRDEKYEFWIGRLDLLAPLLQLQLITINYNSSQSVIECAFQGCLCSSHPRKLFVEHIAMIDCY
jgi:hypothetical protein